MNNFFQIKGGIVHIKNVEMYNCLIVMTLRLQGLLIVLHYKGYYV